MDRFQRESLDRIADAMDEESVDHPDQTRDEDPDEVDKQEILEVLVNRNFVTEIEALVLAEQSLAEIQALYDNHSFPIDEPVAPSGGYPTDSDQNEEAIDEVDDDPQCGFCGVYRSEHALCGCPDGFVTAEAWARERTEIRERAYRDVDRNDDYPIDEP